MIRRIIEELAGYTPGEQPNPNTTTLKLNTNENPYPPSPKAMAVLSTIQDELLKVYPPADAESVRHAAADELNINPNEVIVGNGSDDILTILNRLTLEPGSHSLAMAPTYTLYRVLAQLQGAHLKELPFGDNFTMSNAFIEDDSPLKFIPNPNAPTGTLMDKASIVDLCEKSKGIVVVDEAYIDFAPKGSTSIDLIHTYNNLVITRTLSKSYSLAGLRLGLGIANASLIAQMHKVRDSYNIDIISQLIATEALKDSRWMRSNAQKIMASRTFLNAELLKRKWHTIESHTNFILCRPPGNLCADEIYHGLKENNILVRHFSDSNVQDFIRISIGTDEQCRALLMALDLLYPPGAP